MVTENGLQKLDFVNHKDFILQDAGDGVVYIAEWKSISPQPSTEEIEAAHNEWQEEYDAQAYARNRQAEYPPLNDLIVALWEGVVEERMASLMELEVQRQAVKAKYPK